MKDKRNWREEMQKGMKEAMERRARMSPEELERYKAQREAEGWWPITGIPHREDEEE